jgi:hypothetical protein
MKKISKPAWALLFPAGCAMLLYSAYYAFAASLSPVWRPIDYLNVGIPILCFPLFCLLFISFRTALICLLTAWSLRYGIYVAFLGKNFRASKVLSLPEEVGIAAFAAMALAFVVDRAKHKHSEIVS